MNNSKLYELAENLTIHEMLAEELRKHPFTFPESEIRKKYKEKMDEIAKIVIEQREEVKDDLGKLEIEIGKEKYIEFHISDGQPKITIEYHRPNIDRYLINAIRSTFDFVDYPRRKVNEIKEEIERETK